MSTHTSFKGRSGLEVTLALFPSKCKMRKGARISSKARGEMERMLSSNSRVKSKPPRQSVACGPKVLSTWSHDSEAIAAILQNDLCSPVSGDVENQGADSSGVECMMHGFIRQTADTYTQKQWKSFSRAFPTRRQRHTALMKKATAGVFGRAPKDHGVCLTLSAIIFRLQRPLWSRAQVWCKGYLQLGGK